MSPSSDDPRPSAAAAGKPTLDQLLRVKRAERPDAAFWDEFDRGLRQKQLAASIEPRPWWLGLSLLSRRLAPLGLPVSAGAAALLALMVFRTQLPGPGASSGPAETGATVVATRSTSLAALNARDVSPAVAPRADAIPAETAAQPAAASASYALASSPSAPERETAPASAEAAAPAVPVVAALLELSSATPTPSELTIAQNLETVRAEEPELIAAAAPRLAKLAEARAEDPTEGLAAEVSRVLNPRQARLLAMADSSESDGADLSTVRERMVHRLVNDDTNYGSSSRLATAGDRFSLSF